MLKNIHIVRFYMKFVAAPQQRMHLLDNNSTFKKLLSIGVSPPFVYLGWNPN